MYVLRNEKKYNSEDIFCSSFLYSNSMFSLTERMTERNRNKETGIKNSAAFFLWKIPLFYRFEQKKLSVLGNYPACQKFQRSIDLFFPRKKQEQKSAENRGSQFF